MATSPASDLSSVVELDSLTVHVIVDNNSDMTSLCCGCLSGGKYKSQIAAMAGSTGELSFDKVLDAAHGLSLLCVMEVGAEKKAVLFDAGPRCDRFRDNVEKLGVELTSVEAVVLSHWHIDHSGGLPAAVEMVAEARKVAGLAPPTVSLHPGRPIARGLRVPSGKVLPLLPLDPTLEQLTTAGGSVVSPDPASGHTVADRWCFVSGTIPRVTSYETGLANHVAKMEKGGEFLPDPEILDERYMAFRVKGEGAVVLSSCSHAGIVNVCTDVKAKAPEGTLAAVMGGFHLSGGGGMEDRHEATLADLVKLDPKLVLPGLLMLTYFVCLFVCLFGLFVWGGCCLDAHPSNSCVSGHCTGWRATAKIIDAFPERAQPLSVGSSYTFSAGASDKK